MSSAQSFWAYAHLKKYERRRHKEMYDFVKLVCSFINPTAAESYFSVKPESVENTGFAADLKKLDPNFDESKYSEVLE
jgi:hypothetical protein